MYIDYHVCSLYLQTFCISMYRMCMLKFVHFHIGIDIWVHRVCCCLLTPNCTKNNVYAAFLHRSGLQTT